MSWKHCMAGSYRLFLMPPGVERFDQPGGKTSGRVGGGYRKTGGQDRYHRLACRLLETGSRSNVSSPPAAIMRTGKKVAVTRMELHNDEDLLIAVGTGTYIVG